MKSEEYLNKVVKVKVDRKLGSKHPKYNYVYPINYGYVPDTISGDGEELDCYIIGVFDPVLEFEGRCIAIIKRINDNDDKLIIAPKDKEYSDEAIEALVEFQERFFEHRLVR
jgi:inorganic pyrophosphatase